MSEFTELEIINREIDFLESVNPDDLTSQQKSDLNKLKNERIKLEMAAEKPPETEPEIAPETKPETVTENPICFDGPDENGICWWNL